MIDLRPMTREEFLIYLERAIVEYADDKVKAGNWPEEGALERSKQEFEMYLPRGNSTPGHSLCTIYDVETGVAVGILWYANMPEMGKPAWFVYDFYIHENQRRRGYAVAALACLEELAKVEGVNSIGLHVFGHNIAARQLYEKAGYEITNINMRRKLNG
ncbi:MAG: GNAT family N-acetyltransferase [Bellilinea sp.]